MKTKSLTQDAEIEALDLLYKLNKDAQKVYTLCTENIARILASHPLFVNRLRYDAFRNLYEVRPLLSEVYRPFEDSDVIAFQTQISVSFDFFQKVGKEMVYDAMMKVFKQNAYDSAKDYITSLTWDNVPRLSTWLSSTFGAPDDVYHQAVGSNWLKGAVKRAIEPGCKFDFVLVLEGRQGSKKSTSLSVLFRGWHIETTMGTDNKDFFMQMQGKLCAEFSEGETLSRTEVKKMKAIISTQVDTYRPPYGRAMIDYPRRCVFAMTTNQEEYLKDETGNRRWLPVRVLLPQANVEWLEANREQLFAEAHHRVVILKETVYEFPTEEMLSAQDERRIKDPNADMIAEWYYGLDDKQRVEGVTSEQVFKDCYNHGFQRPSTRSEQISIANVLNNDLKLPKRQVMKNGIRKWYWYPKDPLENVEIKIAETSDVVA